MSLAPALISIYDRTAATSADHAQPAEHGCCRIQAAAAAAAAEAARSDGDDIDRRATSTPAASSSSVVKRATSTTADMVRTSGSAVTVPVVITPPPPVCLSVCLFANISPELQSSLRPIFKSAVSKLPRNV